MEKHNFPVDSLSIGGVTKSIKIFFQCFTDFGFAVGNFPDVAIRSAAYLLHYFIFGDNVLIDFLTHQTNVIKIIIILLYKLSTSSKLDSIPIIKAYYQWIQLVIHEFLWKTDTHHLCIIHWPTHLPLFWIQLNPDFVLLPHFQHPLRIPNALSLAQYGRIQQKQSHCLLTPFGVDFIQTTFLPKT